MYWGLGPLVVRVLDNACHAATSSTQFPGWECLGGLILLAVPRFYKTLADAGLCKIMANSTQRLVGDGVAYESFEDQIMPTICHFATMPAFMFWQEPNAAGMPAAIRNAIDSAINPQANTPEEEKFGKCLMFGCEGEGALVELADAESGVNGARASPSGCPCSEWFLDARNNSSGEDDGRPKYEKIPSTVRQLARDPRVLVGWPLPLGFGLDGRLLLERRGRRAGIPGVAGGLGVPAKSINFWKRGVFFRA